ncbi:MAG: multidrug MFS transporter [Chloroflexi bacterium]|nr:MAG: multidrug MFS transporter [Chloroflexota bacterium]
MILVTTGTSGEAFDRLLGAVETLGAGESIVVQHGPSRLRPANARCVDFVAFTELVRLVQDARVVVTHGGVGSILVVLMNDKRPLVVPRLAQYGEAVDNHQLELATKLAEADLVTVVDDPTELGAFVRTADAKGNHHGERSDSLVEHLRRYLFSVGSATRG